MRDSRESSRFCSGGFFHTAKTNASRANTNLFAGSVNYGANALDIGIPAATPGIVGVADYVAVVGAFAAKFTLQCHNHSCALKG
jgi:N-acyl-L-homoserine lactone synthetase